MKENILVNVSPDADFFNLLTFSYYHKWCKYMGK
jgi:hypothetical protein